MANKKRLLIFGGAPYIFNEALVPFVPKLTKIYDIFILLNDLSMPKGLPNILKLWKDKGIINDYLIAPNGDESIKTHLFYMSNIKFLRSFKFDMFLTLSAMIYFDRYLIDCILPSSCVKVVFWNAIPYLMEREELSRNILAGANIEESVMLGTSGEKTSSLNSLASQISKAGSFGNVMRKAMNRVWLLFKRNLYDVPLSKTISIFNYFIFPFMLTGKVFKKGKYDFLTNLGTDQFDAIIFRDEMETQLHRIFYGNNNIFTAQCHSYGNCRCEKENKERTAILSPLSGFVGNNSINEDQLNLYCRDCKIVMDNTGAKELHLRLHPRENGRWPYLLVDRLNKIGIKAKVVGSDKPIREIMCDYLGIVGFASSTLRDSRAACDYCFTVGFVAISKNRYKNPKYVYGNGEGISWIEEDGSCRSEIFRRQKHISEKGEDMIELIERLAGIKK